MLIKVKTGNIVATWTIGVIGSLIMGFGMSKIMVGDPSIIDMIIGLVSVKLFNICVYKK